MSNIFENVKKNILDWDSIYSESQNNKIINEVNVDVNVIIGFRGRDKFIIPIINSFFESFQYYNTFSENKKKFALTFVEHDINPYNSEIVKYGVNYFWSKGNQSDQFNRSFCFNYGFKFSTKSKYYLFHDIDILVKKDFFLQLFENLGISKCLQSYGNRHIWYMSENLTENYLKQNINLSDINKEHHEISAPSCIGSMGGSIFVEHDVFFDVGGFDPELFWGYAPEDQMFWSKCLTLLGEINYCDNPSIDLFHMWHPPTHDTNPLLTLMHNYLNEYNSLHKEKKFLFLKLKSTLL